MPILVLLLVLFASPAAADRIEGVPSGGCGTVLHDDKIIVRADREIRTALFWGTEATCGATLETPLPSITFIPAATPGESFDYVVYGYQLPCSGRIQFDAAFDASFTDFAFVGVLGKNCAPTPNVLGEGFPKLPLTLETINNTPEPYTGFTPKDPETPTVPMPTPEQYTGFTPNDPETPTVPMPVPEPSTLVLTGSALAVLFRRTARPVRRTSNDL
jgi:hypothetical protein